MAENPKNGRDNIPRSLVFLMYAIPLFSEIFKFLNMLFLNKIFTLDSRIACPPWSVSNKGVVRLTCKNLWCVYNIDSMYLYLHHSDMLLNILQLIWKANFETSRVSIAARVDNINQSVRVCVTWGNFSF